MMMQPGDQFYWLKLQSLDDWAEGSQIICRSTFAFHYAPTEMLVSTKGRYFRPDQVYSTQEEAIEAALAWIDEQRELLRQVRAELDDLRRN